MANESETADRCANSETQNASSSKYKTSACEKQLHDSVASGNVEEARRLLAEGVKVDCPDEHGMTALQHAAYKGHHELCELFLSHGADVNDISHEHGYTALMFGALSSKKEVVKLLLERGACVGFENTVHKTASQMAAFVGQHEIVSLINNFFPREELDYYCQPRGLETEPKLVPNLAAPLYKYILTVNLSSVKLSYVLRQHVELLENAEQVMRVLDLLCEKMMKQRNTNEILAMKFCYLSQVLKQAAKSHRIHQAAATDTPILESWIKYLLKVDSDGELVNQEKLVRSTLSEFPYVECQLMQQMVRTITSSASGASALSVLLSCINGQRFASAEDKMCETCGELHAKSCAVCKSVNYCDKVCQKLHWPTHKKECKQLALQHAEVAGSHAGEPAEGKVDGEPAEAEKPVGNSEGQKSLEVESSGDT